LFDRSGTVSSLIHSEKQVERGVANELILVGSIPLDTPEEVFVTFGVALGRYLFAMPDGEVGPRRHWISRVHYQVLAAHPEFEVVQRPAPDENGVERQHPRNAADAWWFKVKAGVKEVRFGDPGWRLGFARDAINSYFVFTVMKERGILPQSRGPLCFVLDAAILNATYVAGLAATSVVRPVFLAGRLEASIRSRQL
jgi:hypothetical protein